MKANCVPNPAMLDVVRGVIAAATDLFDGPARVRLVEGDFNPADPATWPVASAAFALLDAGGAWVAEYDAVEGNYKLVAPDPDGGWDFISTASGVTITGFIAVLSTDVTVKITANTFLSPVPVTSIGQHVILPYVDFPLGNLLTGAVSPMVLE